MIGGSEVTEYVVPIAMFEQWVKELGLPADTECIERWECKWWKEKMIPAGSETTGFKRLKAGRK